MRSARDFDVSTKLIVTFLRDRPAAKVGHPPALFTEVFDLARATGLHVVAHAGEEGPPDYVRQALDLLHAERIDHGIRSLEDDALVERLVRDRSLLACVNSDDPAYFGGYIDDNVAALGRQFGLDTNRLALLARNGIEASFLNPAEKTSLYAEVDAWQAAQA